jgi:predicted transcriptional regulator/transcriptional regulator with XRE-family HTH domain
MAIERESKVFAGERLRRLRVSRGLAQRKLAETIAVSPSYLSQMEADLRPIPVALRSRLSELFGIADSYFGDDDDERLAASLREATGDPLFGRRTVAAEETRATVRASPEIAERFLTLYRAYLALDEQLNVQRGDGVAGDSAGPAPHFAYDEVRDWVQSHHNYFDALDRAAERMAEHEGFTPATLQEDLARYLRDRHNITVRDAPTLLAEGTVWRLQRNPGTLLLAEEASNASKTFWMAHVIGLLDQRGAIMRIVRESPLSTTEARALARIGLANYFAGGLIMPYGNFLREAQLLRYDIQRLQTRFGTSFEQVCHRLSTMQRRGMPGIPFYLVKTDIAGNVLKRSSATRFKFARFGGPCPLWNVYRAFAQPGRLLVQVARTPDGVAYLNIARTVGGGGSSYLSRPRNVALVIGCEIEYATETVYAAGLDLHDPNIADPIGPGCRACERVDCRHRAVPPASQALDVGTVERGVVPYRIRP